MTLARMSHRLWNLEDQRELPETSWENNNYGSLCGRSPRTPGLGKWRGGLQALGLREDESIKTDGKVNRGYSVRASHCRQERHVWVMGKWSCGTSQQPEDAVPAVSCPVSFYEAQQMGKFANRNHLSAAGLVVGFPFNSGARGG
ncbi:hypothetical protein P7K49_012811 [Saguinus oedipus]|uniref:Uncharacterized protein n=1 Tax=Saguinus oedipus TaxID=9490 RepID=A0ABQ9VEQ5_SAGOE|nr:hypothetical protein P7K49_012811 [Saguinus oedipus]